MKTKATPKQAHPKKTHPIRIIALSILALVALGIAFYAVLTRIQYEQKILKEDITFARMETYVNTAKAYLESELPNGGWRIEKYCEKPGSKGTIDEYNYGCYYGVVASQDLTNIEVLKHIAQNITGDISIYIYPDHPSFSFDAEFDPKLPRSCGFYSWEENGARLASVDCDATAYILRYELRD